MSPFRNVFTVLCLVPVVVLASCALPQGVAVQAPPSKAVPLEAGQARLVFQVGLAKTAARALVDAGYLTLEMRSADDGTVKYADASREVDGTYLIDVQGLVAGVWSLKVRLYSDIDSPTLLYYADTSQHVAVGVPTSVSLKVYEPSSLSGGTITLADKVEYLEVEGRGQVWGTSLNPEQPRPLQVFRPGEVVQIHALPMSVPTDTNNAPLFDELWDPTFDLDTLDNPLGNDEDYFPDWDDNTDQGLLARPATDARVTYVSDDPEVFEVSSTGRLRARGIGEAILTITTVEGRKTVTIPIRVEETIVGVWTFGSPLDTVLRIDRSAAGELWGTLTTNLDDPYVDAEIKRGRVVKQLDGSYKVTFSQVWGFPMVGASWDRTKRTFNPAMNSSATLSEEGGGTLGVQIGMYSAFRYERLGHYVPVNRLDSNDTTPFMEPVTNDGWTVDPARWDLENDTAGEPETFGDVFWWVEDTSVAVVQSKTGVVDLISPGTTRIYVQSVDNPNLPPLSWELTVEGVAPSLVLENFDVTIPAGYADDQVPGEYQHLNLRIQVPFDPADYRYLDLEKWNAGTWTPVVTFDLQGQSVGSWFDTYLPTTFSTVQRYRVVTKGSLTGGFSYDSAPSPEVVAMSPNFNGNPVLWNGPNEVPGGDTIAYYDADGEYSVPVFDDGAELYRSRWFTSTDGSSWNPSIMHYLRWGTRTWWIYSDNVSGSYPGTYVIARDHQGVVGTPVFLGVKQVHGIGSVQPNGNVLFLGSEATTSSLYWNPTAREYTGTAP